VTTLAVIVIVWVVIIPVAVILWGGIMGRRRERALTRARVLARREEPHRPTSLPGDSVEPSEALQTTTVKHIGDGSEQDLQVEPD
jgi:hypothetical protein